MPKRSNHVAFAAVTAAVNAADCDKSAVFSLSRYARFERIKTGG